jgi:membrane protease YdiL (CAAX protease family)
MREAAMVARAATLPHPGIRGAAAGLATIGLFAGACAASMAVALLNQPYFEAVNRLVRAEGEVARGLLFSSWLVLIAVPIVAWRPRAFGLTFGSIAAHWRLVAGVTAAAAALTWVALGLAGPVPYSTASPFIEIVDVPVTEELLFRGVLLTALLAILRRYQRPGTAAVVAIAIDGVAFGLAHLANGTSLELDFVATQAAFACALGAGCAFLMVRTGSVYPAILLHGAVNAVVVLR